MPDNTDFAVLYKKLIDRSYTPDPTQIEHARDALMALLSERSPPGADKSKVDTERPS